MILAGYFSIKGFIHWMLYEGELLQTTNVVILMADIFDRILDIYAFL